MDARERNRLDVVTRRRLNALESRIDDGLEKFIEVGTALAEIQRDKLYRESHKSFEAYVRQRFGLKRNRAYQLIDAAEAATEAPKILGAKMKETHAVQLAKVPPEQRGDVWQEAVETAPVVDGKPKVTAAHVKTVAGKRQPDSPVGEPDKEPVKTQPVSYFGRFKAAWESHCEPIVAEADATGKAAIRLFLEELF